MINSAARTYRIKEIFRTLQGEGANAGRSAIFIRFAGCNLWSGREQDRTRGRGSCAIWCDTEFYGGEELDSRQIIERVRRLWAMSGAIFVVLTGGEPLLQLDRDLVDELHREGCALAIETNGTIATDLPLDWICVSPKVGAELKLTAGDELKVIYPQENLDLRGLENLSFRYFFIQPMDGPAREENTRAAIDFCTRHPRWRLSLQIHKLIGIP